MFIMALYGRIFYFIEYRYNLSRQQPLSQNAYSCGLVDEMLNEYE